MRVDLSEVKRIAGLAHLQLSEAEADQLSQEMTRILEHAEALRMLPRAAGVSPSPDETWQPSVLFELTELVVSADSDTDRNLADAAGLPTDAGPIAGEFFVVPSPPGMIDPDPSG